MVMILKAVFIVPEYSVVSKEKNFYGQLDNTWEFDARMRLWSCPSLSLLTVAGMMPEGSDIEYIDLNYMSEPELSADWAFFSPSTSQVNRAYQLADKLRKKGIKVAMGGPHVTVLPFEAIAHSDTVFLGESEETFPLFLEDIKNNSVKNLYQSLRFPQLKSSPVPAYHLAKNYPYKSIPIQTSRGCPHQCSFCLSSKIYGSRIRCKTDTQIKNELSLIKKTYGKPYVFFTDDNLFINKCRNDRFLATMKDIHLNWYAFSDAGIAEDPKLLSTIADAGCTQLLIGFESLSSDNLKSLNMNSWKMNKLKSYKEIINRIQSYGIGVVGSFVLGFDNDTVEVFEDLYKFIEETSLYATNITILTPFPGTKTYCELKKENRLVCENWSAYNGFELTFKPKNMTVQEFECGYKELNIKLNSSERINRMINHFKTVLKKI